MKKDLEDLNLLLKSLVYESHHPFDENQALLQTLDTGLIANEAVNCDTAKTVGLRFQKGLDNITLSEASI